MFLRGSLILISLLNIGSCSDRGAASRSAKLQSGIIKVTENRKYGLEAIFSGYDLDLKGGAVKVISSVTIRSKVTGQEVKYQSGEGPSESDGEAYFTDVWSPDEELLLLPLNRFAGFCIVRASEAVDTIGRKQCNDTIRVYARSGPSLSHDFEKWDGNESFIFKAGLYGDNTKLKYDIISGRLTALDSNLIDNEGQNSKGKIAITAGRS